MNTLPLTGASEGRTVSAPFVITTLSVTGMLVVSQLYLPIPLLGLLGNSFGVTAAAASWVASAFGFAYALGFLVFGPLSDRYGRKAIFVPGLFGLALATLAVGFSPSYEVLIALRIVQGVVAATFVPVALAYTGEMLVGTARVVGLALFSVLLLVGGIVGQVYGSAVGMAFGWVWVCLPLALAYALSGFVLARRLPESRGHSGSVSLGQTYLIMLGLLSKPTLLAIYGGGLVLLFSFVSFYSGLGPYLANNYQVGAGDLLLIRAVAIPGMLLSPLTSRLALRWGNQWLVATGYGLSILGLGLEAVSTQLPLLIIASLIFVIGIALAAPALLNLLNLNAGKARGAAIALYTFVLFVGASLGPQFANLLLPLGFGLLCAAVALVLIIATTFVMLASSYQ